MNIIGKNVYLRAMELEDMELYRESINNPEIESLVGGWSFPVAKEQQLSWYNACMQDKRNIRLTIVDKENDCVLGMLNITDIDWKSGIAFSGIKLFKKDIRKKGIGFDAVMIASKYAFDELRLNRLEGTILSNNIASKKLYEKCGWKEEGIRRESQYKNGVYFDEYYVGILKKDFNDIRKQYGY